MVNADLRSAEVIKRLVNIDLPSVAEVGVYHGDMSRRLMYRLNLHLLMVDPWGDYEVSESYKNSGDPMATMSKEEWAKVQEEALKSVSWAADRVRVFHGTSAEAAESLDEQYDLVFIDAAHDYDNASADIELWWPKVVSDGYIGGHDYGRPEFGVTEAVNDFCEEHGLALELGQNYTWFIKKE